MPYSCNTCGAVAESPGHLCNPCGDTESCSFCGAAEVDARHICRDKLSAMQFTCGGCGRVAMEAKNLCKPEPINP
ncbi:hypothetical protein [Desulfogranum mediterraneum]|uniref:hypothetical protein n=1 Tax=Desulfogranum mediterraneum TaxID=160661 RepID=UPI00040B40B9|nr:hypothetical protein [Desulfogranum mediterraneum]